VQQGRADDILTSGNPLGNEADLVIGRLAIWSLMEDSSASFIFQ
jgi:hypothetical protein